jgi:DNA-binding CsgD family transcriptional regulator
MVASLRSQPALVDIPFVISRTEGSPQDRVPTNSHISQTAAELIGVPMVALRRSGSVIWATPSAQHMFLSGNGVRLSAGALQFDDTATEAQFSVLLRGAHRSPPSHASMIANSHSGTPLLIQVLELRDQEDSFDLVIFTDLSPPPPPQDVLRRLFGLGRAEVEVAIGLLKGLSPREIALERDVSMPTLRTQLRAIYRKTNSRGQADLVRLLARFPTTRMAFPGRELWL